MSFADELTDEFCGGTTDCPACENDGQPCNLCKPGSIPIGFADEDRIHAIVREEIAAYFRNLLRTQTISGGTLTYREYLHTRDEPPAAPPLPTVNTTERL